jgi:hypothetical protein
VSAPKISKKSANGLDTMYFDGTLRGYKYTSFTINTASHSFFFVGKSSTVTANTGYNYVIAFQDPAGGSPYIVYPYYNTGTGGMKGYITSFDSTPIDFQNSTLVDNAIANKLAISCAVIESGNQKIYKDGVAQSSNTQSLTSSTSPYLFLGNYPAASGYHFEGTLCEVIIFNATISNTNREKIEGYFAWKWGLVSSLPSTHPYKLFPPPP